MEGSKGSAYILGGSDHLDTHWKGQTESKKSGRGPFVNPPERKIWLVEKKCKNLTNETEIMQKRYVHPEATEIPPNSLRLLEFERKQERMTQWLLEKLKKARKYFLKCNVLMSREETTGHDVLKTVYLCPMDLGLGRGSQI